MFSKYRCQRLILIGSSESLPIISGCSFFRDIWNLYSFRYSIETKIMSNTMDCRIITKVELKQASNLENLRVTKTLYNEYVLYEAS